MTCLWHEDKGYMHVSMMRFLMFQRHVMGTDSSGITLSQVSGDVTYNGRRFDEFVAERTSAYVNQYDEVISFPLVFPPTFQMLICCGGTERQITAVSCFR